MTTENDDLVKRLRTAFRIERNDAGQLVGVYVSGLTESAMALEAVATALEVQEAQIKLGAAASIRLAEALRMIAAAPSMTWQDRCEHYEAIAISALKEVTGE